jgi:LysM repeat protein
VTNRTAHASRITHHASRSTLHPLHFLSSGPRLCEGKFPRVPALGFARASSRSLILPLLLLALLLTACERPLRDDPVLPTTTIITPEGGATIAVPTTDPLVATPLPPADATPVPPAADATVAPPTTEQQYTVQAGDSLGLIAQNFGVSAEEIAAANNMATIEDTIYVGQVLTIPVPGTSDTPAGSATVSAGGEIVHIVQAGETLYRIALLYSTTYQELAAYNNLANPDDIEVGQALLIPPSQ